MSKDQILEPNFRKKYHDAGKQLKDHFIQTKIEVSKDKLQKLQQIVLNCKYLPDLLNDLLLKRQINL